MAKRPLKRKLSRAPLPKRKRKGARRYKHSGTWDPNEDWGGCKECQRLAQLQEQ